MLPEKISPIQCRDTALAFAFIALLVWFFTENISWIYGCMGLVLLAMIWPSAMTYPAKLWFGFSHVLGTFMSKVLLSIIYMLILMPVSLVRRLLAKDSMRIRSYKDSQESAFVVREHTFSKDDITYPY